MYLGWGGYLEEKWWNATAEHKAFLHALFMMYLSSEYFGGGEN